MERTRATRSGGRPPLPPARSTKVQVYGSGRGAARTEARAALVDLPVARAQEQVPDVVEPVGPGCAYFDSRPSGGFDPNTDMFALALLRRFVLGRTSHFAGQWRY